MRPTSSGERFGASVFSTTRMLLSVSVPVLSEQMTVVEPIVSVATIFRTRLLSARIFRMPRPSAMTTARGSPSGTATTMIATATMKY